MRRRAVYLATVLVLLAVVGWLARKAPVQVVVLWTDVCIWLIVFALAGLWLYGRRVRHVRDAWRRVLRRPMIAASLVVLCAYALVGLADSVHFRRQLQPSATGQVQYSDNVYSLLDIILTPLRTHVEMTYSAPFATRLFAYETVERPDGTLLRTRPRLRYGGADLKNPRRDAAGDIARRSARGLLDAVVVEALLLTVIIAVLHWKRRQPGIEILRQVIRGRTELPWRTMLTTAGVIVAAVCVGAQLAGHYHILGTDKVGEDVLYEALKSVRTGLVIGTVSSLVMLPFGIVLGIMAGYFRGWIDDVIQYVYTTLSSIPGVLLIAAAVLTLQIYMTNHASYFSSQAVRADVRLFFLCVILGVTSWTSLCRLLRGETLKLREADYVQAALVLGTRRFSILRRHILPNVMHIVLITVALDFSGLVLAEAVLSYVGVGVDPTMNSWGNMINSARLELARDPVVWWSILAAFVSMFTLVLAANLFADAVRDAFDPRLRERTSS